MVCSFPAHAARRARGYPLHRTQAYRFNACYGYQATYHGVENAGLPCFGRRRVWHPRININTSFSRQYRGCHLVAKWDAHCVKGSHQVRVCVCGYSSASRDRGIPSEAGPGGFPPLVGSFAGSWCVTSQFGNLGHELDESTNVVVLSLFKWPLWVVGARCGIGG